MVKRLKLLIISSFYRAVSATVMSTDVSLSLFLTYFIILPFQVFLLYLQATEGSMR